MLLVLPCGSLTAAFAGAFAGAGCLLPSVSGLFCASLPLAVRLLLFALRFCPEERLRPPRRPRLEPCLGWFSVVLLSGLFSCFWVVAGLLSVCTGAGACACAGRLWLACGLLDVARFCPPGCRPDAGLLAGRRLPCGCLRRVPSLLRCPRFGCLRCCGRVLFCGLVSLSLPNRLAKRRFSRPGLATVFTATGAVGAGAGSACFIDLTAGISGPGFSPGSAAVISGSAIAFAIV